MVALRATDPRIVVPSVKVTCPYGGTPVDEVTVAVNVMVEPTDEGFSDDVKIVDVDTGTTTSSKVAEVDGAELLSPKYWAVTAYVPALSFSLVKIAFPLTSGTMPRFVTFT